MKDNTCRVLLVEDNPVDVQLIELMITDADASLRFSNIIELEHTRRLSETLEKLAVSSVHLILLDLSLPDSEGLDTLKAVKGAHPELPVVVLTGMDDELFGVRAVKEGAQDYLIKGQIDSFGLTRAIHYAVERNQLRLEIEARYQQEKSELERLIFSRPMEARLTREAARLYGEAPLSETAQHLWVGFKERYGEILEKSLEVEAYQVENDIQGRLKALARELGFLKAAPRDVVDIHTATLKEKTKNASRERASAYLTEARLMLIELLGHLAAFYRHFFVGLGDRRRQHDLEESRTGEGTFDG